MDYRKTRGAVFSLTVHIVFVVKYRKRVLTDEMLSEIETQIDDICSGMSVDLMEFGGELDHVHILVSMPPRISVSALVNAIKGATSRILRKQHQEIERALWNGILWSPSYFATTTGGAPLEAVKRYIEQQGGAPSSLA